MNGSEAVKNFLAHYGVKGMKWGVRKDRAEWKQSPRPGSSPGVAVPRRDGGRWMPGKRQYDTRKLSNKELKAVVDRMKLEQEFERLNKIEKGEGAKYREQLLKTAGTAIVTGVVGYGVKEILKSSKIPKAGSKEK